MDHDTRARIRHLYFVERMPLHAIAEALVLAPRAVRGALVLHGGHADRRDPEPVSTALEPSTTSPIAGLSVAPAGRRVATRHR